MILEVLQHFFTPAPKHVKALGLVREAIAIEARADRCATNWAPHLDMCKQQILKAASGLPNGSNIMILGSGSLYDVPVEALLRQGHHLTCVDIVRTAKGAKKYPGVNFIEKDLTGIAEDFYNQVGSKRPYDGRIAFRWEMEVIPDLVISLNLMSQLAINLVSFAQKQNVALHEKFADNIMSAHLSWLKSLKTHVLLIGDIKRDYYYEGKLVRSEKATPTLEYFDRLIPQEKWPWDVAPLGEAGRGVSIKHTVGAWLL